LDSAAAAATAAAIAAIPLATTTIPGLIEEATGEETRLGATDANKDDRAVTPGSMSYTLQTGKDYKIRVGVDGADSVDAGFFNNRTTNPYKRAIVGLINDVSDVTTQATGILGYAASGIVPSTNSSGIFGVSGLIPNGVTNNTTLSMVKFAGVLGTNAAAGSGNKTGVAGDSFATGGTNIGVYGTAANGATNWAGYFEGNVAGGAYTTLSDATLKENVQPIDPAKALQFRNGLQWKRYEMFTEQQVEIMQDVTDSEGNTTQVPTGRYQAIRNSQGIKRGLIAQEVLALAQSIGDFTDVVVEVGEYFTLDAQGYPAKDAQGNNIVNKRLGIDYGSVNVIVMAGEQVAAPLAG
jgi:hypothetical protein